MSTARVDFTRGAAERIARVVRLVEQGDRDGQPLTFRKVPDDPAKIVKEITWAADWKTGATAVVTFKVSTLTATALNYHMGVGPGEGWAARSSGAWRLISFDWSKQPGYSATAIQIAGHGSTDGIFQWFNSVTCSTAA